MSTRRYVCRICQLCTISEDEVVYEMSYGFVSETTIFDVYRVTDYDGNATIQLSIKQPCTYGHWDYDAELVYL